MQLYRGYNRSILQPRVSSCSFASLASTALPPSPTLTRGRRDQDRLLPIANISRIMKRALPGNAKIAKDAKETVQECLSEFISFITSE